MVSRFIERRQQADWSLEAAIIQTIAYFSIFKYPLTEWELWSFLPQKAELIEVRQEVQRLLTSGQLAEKWGYYFLPGQMAIVNCRQQRYPVAIAKIKKAQRVANWLRWLPGVQFVALANLMGAYNLRAGGDIDLFIITKPNCLWFCRFWAALILQLLGLRPTIENRRDKICLSFWLSSDNLRIDQFKLPDQAGLPDWYYIYWLANLRPLVEQGLSYQQVIKQNPWLKTYLPNWRAGIFSRNNTVIDKLAAVVSSLGKFKAKIWEKSLAGWQQKFLPVGVRELMNLDQRVVVNNKVIKLHVIDRRGYFRNRLLEILNKFKKGEVEVVKTDPLNHWPLFNFWFKLSHWLTIGLVLFLPWSTRWLARPGYLGGEFWEYGTISCYASDILLFLVIVAIILAKPIINWRVRLTSYSWWLVGFWLICAGGLLVNQVAWPLVLFYLIRLIFWSAGWYFILVSQPRPLRYWANIFLISLIVPAILGLAQFVIQEAPANKWLGLAQHIPGDLGVAVIESIDLSGQINGRWLRAYGSFDQPNIFGAIMSLAILLALIISIGPISNLLKLFYWLLIGLWSLAMMASWSRAAWLAVVLGWLASLVIIWFKNRRIGRILLLSFFVLIAWIMLWFWPFKDLGRSRITTQPRLEQKSLIERQDGHRQAWSIIKQRPWLGVGLGNYTGFVSGRAEIIGPAWLYQPVHNSLLLIINETGLLGFIWLLGGLMILFWRAQRKNKLIWPLFLAIIWLLLMDHWWWSLHIGIIYFWLWPAILWQIGRQKINLL